MLHAVYVVERFLDNLVKRHCNFHIAFFEGDYPIFSSTVPTLIGNIENSELCIPPEASATHRSRYRLAREVIKRHLICRLQASHPDIIVNSFDSPECTEFREYLNISPIYFVMTHDGTGKPKTSTVESGISDKFAKTILRGMIWFFNTHKLNVALINHIDFRDSKVFTMIVESFTPPSKLRLSMTAKFVRQIHDARKSLIDSRHEDGKHVELAVEATDLGFQEIGDVSSGEKLNECTYLTVYTASKILEQHKDEVFMVSAFILHSILLRNIPLSRRRLPLVTFDQDFEEQITKFLATFSSAAQRTLRNPKWNGFIAAQGVERNTVDLLDGRLFRTVIQALCDDSLVGDIPHSVQEDWKILSRIVRALSDEDLPLQGSLDPEFSNTTAIDSDFEYKPEKPSLLPFSSPVFDKHLACIHVNADASVPYRLGTMKLYRETSHWHNHRKPLNPKLAPTEKVSKWRYVIGSGCQGARTDCVGIHCVQISFT
jgi:hypothetical protein